MGKVTDEHITKWEKKRNVGKLIGALRDEDPFIRQRAAWALWMIGDPQAVEPLIASLGDPSEEVRFFAVSYLGKVGDPRAVEPLVSRWVHEGKLHDAIREALEKIGGPEAGEALAPMRVLQDKALAVSVTILIHGRIHDLEDFVGEYNAALPLDVEGPELLNTIAKSIIWKDHDRFYTGYQLICPGGTIKAGGGAKPSTLREAGVKEGDRLELVDGGGFFM